MWELNLYLMFLGGSFARGWEKGVWTRASGEEKKFCQGTSEKFAWGGWGRRKRSRGEGRERFVEMKEKWAKGIED